MKTQSEKTKKANQLNKLLVMELAGITEEQYNELIFQHGCEYAEKEIGSELQIKIILQSKMYWKWWGNSWNRRNEEFLERLDISLYNSNIFYNKTIINRGYAISIAIPLLTQQDVLREFEELHKRVNTFPGRMVLEESYKELIHSVVKSKV